MNNTDAPQDDSSSHAEAPDRDGRGYRIISKRRNKRGKDDGRWLSPGTLGFAISVVAVVGIMALRSFASRLDFGTVNVLSFLLILIAWISLCVALFRSSFPNWVGWTLLSLPIVGTAAVLSIFRIERVDGELRPQFVYRWAEADQDLANLKVESPERIPSELLNSAPTDFPQFMGVNRDATISSVSLMENWGDNPPKILWKHSVGDGWSGFAVQGSVAITLEQRDASEWVSAYSVSNGELLWNYVIPSKHTNVMGGTGPRSTPTIHEGRVYAASAVSTLACLDLATGQLIWTQDLLELANSTQEEFESQVSWGRSGSPLIVDDLVVVPLGGGNMSQAASLIAFDKQNGEEVWRAGEDQISYSSPTLRRVDGVQQILLVTENTVTGFSPADGKILWSTKFPGSSSGDATASQPIVLNGNQVLLSKGYGTGAKLVQVTQTQDGWEVDEIWKNQTVLKTKFTSCVVREGYAYGLSDGILECVDLNNGKRQWKRGRYRQGQVLLVGDTLLVTAESGKIVLVRATPEQFVELADMQIIGDVTWNTAALVGDLLLIRNSDEMACVRLPIVTTQPASESTEETPGAQEDNAEATSDASAA